MSSDSDNGGKEVVTPRFLHGFVSHKNTGVQITDEMEKHGNAGTAKGIPIKEHPDDHWHGEKKMSGVTSKSNQSVHKPNRINSLDFGDSETTSNATHSDSLPSLSKPSLLVKFINKIKRIIKGKNSCMSYKRHTKGDKKTYSDEPKSRLP